MPIVTMPDNTQVSFPDDMPPDQIKGLIQSKFPDAVSSIGSQPSGVPNGVVDAARALHRMTTNDQSLSMSHGDGPNDQVLSRLDNGIRSIANGATFGFGDRIAAGAGSLTGIGGNRGDYAGNLANEQARTSALDPASDLVGQAVGGAATMGLMPAVGAGAAALKEAPLWLRSLYSAAVGGGAGTLYGASRSKDLTNIPETATNAAYGGITGAGIGAAVPVVGAALGSVLFPKSAEDVVTSRAKITPEVAQQASALMRDAQRPGMDVPLTLQEAVDKASGGKTGLSDLTRVVSNTPEGRPIMDAFYNQRPQQIQNAGAAQLDNIAPNPLYAPKAGLDVQAGADDIIGTTRRAINASEGPFYKSAENVIVPPDAMTPITSDRQAQAAFQWARSKVLSDPVASAKFAPTKPQLPAPGSTISAADFAKLQAGDQPPNTVGFLGEVRKHLADTVDSLTAQGNRGQARNFMPALNGLDQVLKGASPDYAKALEVGATLRQADLNPLENSIIGGVAKTSDLGTQASAVFKPQPVYSDAADAGRLAASLSQDNPKAAEALLRAHLQRAFSESTQNLQGGPNVMGAANFASRIAGNSDQANVIESYMRALPNGDAKWNGFRRLLDIAEATGMKPAMGSNTAYDTKAISDLSGNGPISIAKDVARSGGTIFTKIPGRLSDWYQKVAMGKNTAQIARILVDPRSVKILERLANSAPNDPTAQMLAYRLTFLGNAAADRKMRQ